MPFPPAASHASTRQLMRFRGQAAARRPPLVIVLLIAAILLPEELSFYVGNLRVTIARAILMLIAPYLCYRFITMVSLPNYRVVPSDILVLVAGSWMLASVALIQGMEKAAASAGVLTLEFVMPYLAARTLVDQDEHVLAVIRTICVSTSVVAILSLLDPIYGVYVVHDWFGELTGYVRAAQTDFRMGMLRASGTLEHPILLGTLCALSILLSAAMGPRLRWPVRVCCLLGLVFSFSSGPLGGLLIGLGLIAYGRLFKRLRQRWAIIVGLAVVMAVAVTAVSNNPLGFLLSNFTFDPESAYFRLLIWHYGTASLMHSAVFGIGLDAEWYREDWMPKSVDSFWLMSALNFGIPGSALIGAVWISPFLWPVERNGTDSKCLKSHGGLRTMLNIVMLVIVYIGLSVHFWGATWMLISVLAGLRACLGAEPKDDRL